MGFYFDLFKSHEEKAHEHWQTFITCRKDYYTHIKSTKTINDEVILDHSDSFIDYHASILNSFQDELIWARKNMLFRDNGQTFNNQSAFIEMKSFIAELYSTVFVTFDEAFKNNKQCL